MGHLDIANRSKFAVIPLGGFNPQRAKILKEGIELTLGTSITSMVILDRDYRSQAEVDSIKKEAAKFSDEVVVHGRKEIENFLLVSEAIERAAKKRIQDRKARGGLVSDESFDVDAVLDSFSNDQRAYVQSRYIALRQRFAKRSGSKTHPDKITEDAIVEFDKNWEQSKALRKMIPGKDALSEINRQLQETFKVSVTPSAIVGAMGLTDVSAEVKTLLRSIGEFSH